MEFRAVLKGLTAHHDSLVRGAVFCDEEGERVEAIVNDPDLDSFELDVAGASYAPVVHLLGDTADGARLRVVHEDGVVWLEVLQNRYYLLVLVVRDGLDIRVVPRLEEACHALRELM